MQVGRLHCLSAPRPCFGYRGSIQRSTHRSSPVRSGEHGQTPEHPHAAISLPVHRASNNPVSSIGVIVKLLFEGAAACALTSFSYAHDGDVSASARRNRRNEAASRRVTAQEAYLGSRETQLVVGLLEHWGTWRGLPWCYRVVHDSGQADHLGSSLHLLLPVFAPKVHRRTYSAN